MLKKAITLCCAIGFIGALSAVAQDATPAAAPAPEAKSEVKPEKKYKWERSASIGLTLTKGNSDTILFTGNVIGVRKWRKNELSLGATATYGENSGKVNSDSYGANAQYNRLFSERFFGYVQIDGLHDAIADVEFRLTVGPGAGYYFLKSDKTELSAEVGPSYVYEQLGSGSDSYLSLRVAEKFKYKLSDSARIWQSAEFLPDVGMFSNYILKAQVGAEADLTKKLSLRITLSDTYDNEPAPTRKSNDIKLVSGIAYKF